MDEYNALSHTTWECKYHVVFIPKCRRKTLYLELRRLRWSRKKGGREAPQGEDFAGVQRKLTRAIIFEMREDLDDLLAGAGRRRARLHPGAEGFQNPAAGGSRGSSGGGGGCHLPQGGDPREGC
jgi:hypothetical protein